MEPKEWPDGSQGWVCAGTDIELVHNMEFPWTCTIRHEHLTMIPRASDRAGKRKKRRGDKKVRR